MSVLFLMREIYSLYVYVKTLKVFYAQLWYFGFYLYSMRLSKEEQEETYFYNLVLSGRMCMHVSMYHHTHTQIHTHGCIQVILCLRGSVLPRVSMTHTCACCMVLCRYCVETHFPGSFSLISYLILKSSLWLCHAESSFSLAALTSLPV